MAATVAVLLRRSFSLLSEHLGPFAAIAAVVQFPVTLLVALFVPSTAAMSGLTSSASHALDGLAEVYPLIALGQLAMMAALVVAVADATGGRVPDAGVAYRKVASSLRLLIATGFLVAVGVLLGLFALVLPAIAALVLWSFVVQVVMLDGTGLGPALSRSTKLVSRHLGLVLGLVGVLVIWQILLAGFANLPFILFAGPIAQVSSEALEALLLVTLGLVPVIALTLLYMDFLEEEQVEKTKSPGPAENAM